MCMPLYFDRCPRECMFQYVMLIDACAVISSLGSLLLNQFGLMHVEHFSLPNISLSLKTNWD